MADKIYLDYESLRPIIKRFISRINEDIRNGFIEPNLMCAETEVLRCRELSNLLKTTKISKVVYSSIEADYIINITSNHREHLYNYLDSKIQEVDLQIKYMQGLVDHFSRTIRLDVPKNYNLSDKVFFDSGMIIMPKIMEGLSVFRVDVEGGLPNTYSNINISELEGVRFGSIDEAISYSVKHKPFPSSTIAIASGVSKFNLERTVIPVIKRVYAQGRNLILTEKVI